ncbi:hypothetical protein K458DRAFT_421954 [Lentithecium fluviatile CBS 122367]|uniref:Uncharacterized protein n=1 Tax=Lentithecium fluviatile CBS 122367 TaxID=1168545 RepID=A0A6G1IPH2_9PLEO|nr:hypothetical protein K458DRAFT_421954 [Lentithecium fluviatile CBS 122367]
MAQEERKPSTSIWRRLARRDTRENLKKAATHHAVQPPPQKLHRRPTNTQKKEWRDKPTTAHIQQITTPTQRPRILTISTTRVVASDMRTTPFPASPYVRTVPWDVFLPPDQVYSLVMGFLPCEMEDKWFIYSEGPDNSGKMKVHFHRSWTGMKIATLFIVVDWKGEGAGKIVGVKWNGTDQTVGMNEEEAKYMVSTCCSWVLGVDLEEDVAVLLR